MSLDLSSHEPRLAGPYRLLQRLGEGGMGVVHLALDPQGRAVAVKLLRPHVASDPDARRRLEREVATLRRVRHPRVAAVIDADVDGDVPYIVTHFVPGKPLDSYVRDHGPLPRGHIARVGAVLADALRAIHAAGVVHRDVKPANVLLLDGEPVLIDFGIAHMADESRITHTGLVMGTPGYLSPEIIGGEGVSAATDWWGWGATLAFAATGRPPFGTGPIEVVLDRVRRGDTDLKGVDPGLAATLTSALAVDPARRPTPDNLIRGLAAVAPDRVGPLSADEEPTVRTPPPVGAQAGTSVVPPPARGEAPTAVVLPPAAFGEAATAVVQPPTRPPTRRFDQPAGGGALGRGAPLPPYGRPAPWVGPAPLAAGRPGQAGRPAQAGQTGYAGRSGYPGRPGPGDPRPPASGRPASPAPADTSVEPVDLTKGLLIGVMVALAGVAAVAPYGAVWIAGLLFVAARVTERTRDSFLQRRDLRGNRDSDVLMAVLSSPWRILVAIATTIVALILPELVGIAVAFIVATVQAGAPGNALPGHPLPLAVGMIALLLTAWYGPGGGSIRRGTEIGLQLIVTTPRARIVVWAILALILLSALIVASGPSGPDWGPLEQSRIIHQYFSVEN